VSRSGEAKRKRREKRKAARRRHDARVRASSVLPGVILSEPYMAPDGSMKFSALIAADMPQEERERIEAKLREFAEEDGCSYEEHGIVTLTADAAEGPEQ